MSNLRKSTSFRSRIPVRRRLPQHVVCTNAKKPSTKKSNIDSIQVYKVGRCHSSSLSSGDESCESELEVNKTIFSRNYKFVDFSQPNLMYRSADTISLDGQLDTISTCGSFSSPPSPVNPSKYINPEFINSVVLKKLFYFLFFQKI